MAMELRHSVSVSEPRLPEHVLAVDDFLVARVETTPASGPPWRGCEPDAPELPWATRVHDLECDRHGMRARFLARLRERVAAGASWDVLEEPFARPLRAAFRVLFGGRGRTADSDGFHRWALEVATGGDALPVRQVATCAL